MRVNRRSGAFHRLTRSGNLHIELKSTAIDQGVRLGGLNSEVGGNGLCIHLDQSLPFRAEGWFEVGNDRSHVNIMPPESVRNLPYLRAATSENARIRW